MPIDTFFELKKQEQYDLEQQIIRLSLWEGNKTGKEVCVETCYYKRPIQTHVTSTEKINDKLAYHIYNNRQRAYEMMTRDI